MRKKLLTLLLAVAASVGTMFAEKVKIGDLYYNLDATNQTAEVAINNRSGEIIIPASVTYNDTTYSVTSIDSLAFNYCSGLTSIEIPNSVTSIGWGAFCYCTGLTSVTIPNSITSIGSYTFYGCSGLTSVTIPNSVTSIGNGAFYYCTGLTSVTIPNSVTSIGDDAFENVLNIVYNGTATGSPWGAKSMNGYVDGYLVYSDATKTVLLGCSLKAIGEIVIPNSVTSIGKSAFRDCDGLTSVTIPNSVTSIGSSAFFSCSGLTSVTIPNSVTSIGVEAFSYCTGLTSIDIPNSVTSIGDYAFKSCTGLNSVTIPNSVTSIGWGAFKGCTGLTSIEIPNSVTSIGNSAFYYCTGLTSVTIPNSVTSIGAWAFYYCTGLTSVTCFATTPPQLGIYVFDGVDKSIPLYVPAGSISAYQSADVWKDFTNILPISQQGLEDVQGNNVQCTKIVHNGQIFILRGDKTYTLQGQEVK